MTYTKERGKPAYNTENKEALLSAEPDKSKVHKPKPAKATK